MVKRTISAEILSAEKNKLSLGMSRIKDGKIYELSATLKEEIPDGAVISFRYNYIIQRCFAYPAVLSCGRLPYESSCFAFSILSWRSRSACERRR